MFGISQNRGPTKRRSNKLRAGRRVGAFEGLEQRTLFSVTSTIHNGILEIVGDDQRNSVIVREFSDGKIHVISGRTAADINLINGSQIEVFKASDVRVIKFFGNGHDDIFINSTNRDVWADLGSGDDRFLGGAGNDTVLGGTGDDVIDGQSGHDALDGQQNNDIIIGGLGDDALFGGKGRDVITGGEGVDWLFGGEGVDEIRGGKGGDFLDGGHAPNAIGDNRTDLIYVDDDERGSAPLVNGVRERDYVMFYGRDAVNVMFFEAIPKIEDDDIRGFKGGGVDAMLDEYKLERKISAEDEFRNTGGVAGVAHRYHRVPDFAGKYLSVGSAKAPLTTKPLVTDLLGDVGAMTTLRAKDSIFGTLAEQGVGSVTTAKTQYGGLFAGPGEIPTGPLAVLPKSNATPSSSSLTSGPVTSQATVKSGPFATTLSESKLKSGVASI